MLKSRSAPLLLVAALGCQASESHVEAKSILAVAAPSTSNSGAGLLYGAVTAENGTVYQGRLRFGGDEEALWSNYFNGQRRGNPWTEFLQEPLRPKKILGIEFNIGSRPRLGRPFMARFGDIARLSARGRELTVTMKSGTVVQLARYAADDYADGVRIWDKNGAVIDLHERRIKSIDFLPSPALVEASPIHGTVRTRNGSFTGLIQWNRKACLGADELQGRNSGGNVAARFDAIRSIVRREGTALATLTNGSEMTLAETGGDGIATSGIYVDDARYGRVLVSWEAFERVDFSTGAAPSYADFPPGQPLEGTIVTTSGRTLSGRLVYDIDENESTETLDASAMGVTYLVPFSMIASITPVVERGAIVMLANGEQLLLERSGDLHRTNGGLLAFTGTNAAAEYVPWSEVTRIDFNFSSARGDRNTARSR